MNSGRRFVRAFVPVFALCACSTASMAQAEAVGTVLPNGLRFVIRSTERPRVVIVANLGVRSPVTAVPGFRVWAGEGFKVADADIEHSHVGHALNRLAAALPDANGIIVALVGAITESTGNPLCYQAFRSLPGGETASVTQTAEPRAWFDGSRRLNFAPPPLESPLYPAFILAAQRAARGAPAHGVACTLPVFNDGGHLIVSDREEGRTLPHFVSVHAYRALLPPVEPWEVREAAAWFLSDPPGTDDMELALRAALLAGWRENAGRLQRTLAGLTPASLEIAAPFGVNWKRGLREEERR